MNFVVGWITPCNQEGYCPEETIAITHNMFLNIIFHARTAWYTLKGYSANSITYIKFCCNLFSVIQTQGKETWGCWVVRENNKKGLMHMDMNCFEFFIVSSVPFIWNIIWMHVILWVFGTEFMWICQQIIFQVLKEGIMTWKMLMKHGANNVSINMCLCNE